MSIIDGISYEEVPTSLTFSYVGEQLKINRYFQTRWIDRYRFVNAIFGNTNIIDRQTDTPHLNRNIPDPYVEYTKRIENDFISGHPILYPKNVDSMEGLVPNIIKGAPIPFLDRYYKKCRIRISYETPTYEIKDDEELIGNFNRLKAIAVDPGKKLGIDAIAVRTTNNNNIVKGVYKEFDRYVTKIIQPTMEVIRLPVGYYSWAEGLNFTAPIAGGLIVPISPVGQANITGTFKIRSFAEITYIWHQVPALPRDDFWIYPAKDGYGEEVVGAVFTHLGCVNSEVFDGYKKGTLLLKSVEMKPYRWIDGNRYYDYVYHMQLFEPVDPINTNLSLVPARAPDQAVGHNHFLRLTPPVKDAGTNSTFFCEPFYCLLTHDGTKTGKPVYVYRDFRDLFMPFNKEHMIKYYKDFTVNP